MAGNETFQVNANELLATVKRLIREGNVRRISIRQDGRVIAEFPLTVGVVGAAFAPVLVAVGAVAALLTDCTIEVEREETPTSADQASNPRQPPSEGQSG